jgi:hypothetical protein
LAISLLFCTSACAVPLAPGYRILKESREVRFVPGQPPELRVIARFTLQNTGTSKLDFVDAIFPDEKDFGRKNLHVTVDGREAMLAKLPDKYQQETPNALRIPFDPPWSQKQRRNIVIEYALSSPGDSGARITLGEADFHLGSGGWLPVFQAPKHVLASRPEDPNRTSLAIRVPANFLVLARGAAAGRKEESGEIEYRFALRKEDLAPYVVAGRYAESAYDRKSNPVTFWTVEPLKEDPAIPAGRIAAAWGILQEDFGPLDANIRISHVVESPELRPRFAGEAGAAAAPFPGGVLLNPAALALGIGSEDFLELVTRALAQSWFGNELYTSPDSTLGLGEGLAEYATVVIDEARHGEPARRLRVVALLREYDAARKRAVEKPVGTLTMQDAAEQRRIGLAKAPLFFIALEDSFGEAPVRSGLKQMVMLLRGQEAGYDDLRAALEQSTGKSLAIFFRLWLYEKGIPLGFRDRYEEPGDEKTQKGQ